MKQKMNILKLQLCTWIFLFLSQGASGDSLIDRSEWDKRVTVKTLQNGLTVIMVERHEAPVFSAFLRVAVGAVAEPMGQTGLAHMFEHMAFKGTEKIGTKDYEKEKLAVEEVEQAYQAYNQERNKPLGRDGDKVKHLEEAWKKAMEAADQWVDVGQFMRIISQAGGTDLNAFTNHTETSYMVSFPINQLELWAYLESERLRKPIMRQFYQERNVVWEERRMRTESSPQGRLIEQFLAAAFTAHPYGRPVIGWPSDLDKFSMTQAQKFWETYYVPSNMVLALAGDIHPEQLMPMLEAYFGRLPKKPKPEIVLTNEPEQHVQRNVIAKETAEPIYFEGYHRGNFRDKDDPVYDIIAELMQGGRTSRLYRALVRDQKIASDVSMSSCFPKDEYPCLFVNFIVPMEGHKSAEVKEALNTQLELLKKDLVSNEELQAAKARFQVSLIRSLKSNMGLAEMFASAQHHYGDWHEVFYQFDRLSKVSAEDVRQVARAMFVDENRTAAWIEKIPATSETHAIQKSTKKGGRS